MAARNGNVFENQKGKEKERKRGDDGGLVERIRQFLRVLDPRTQDRTGSNFIIPTQMEEFLLDSVTSAGQNEAEKWDKS